MLFSLRRINNRDFRILMAVLICWRSHFYILERVPKIHSYNLHAPLCGEIFKYSLCISNYDDNQKQLAYQYDDNDQLSEVRKNNISTERYYYDTTGNHIWEETWIGRSYQNGTKYTYNTANQLLSETTTTGNNKRCAVSKN